MTNPSSQPPPKPREVADRSLGQGNVSFVVSCTVTLRASRKTGKATVSVRGAFADRTGKASFRIR